MIIEISSGTGFQSFPSPGARSDFALGYSSDRGLSRSVSIQKEIDMQQKYSSLEFSSFGNEKNSGI